MEETAYLHVWLTITDHDAWPELINSDVTIKSAPQILHRGLRHQHDRSSVWISYLGNHSVELNISGVQEK